MVGMYGLVTIFALTAVLLTAKWVGATKSKSVSDQEWLFMTCATMWSWYATGHFAGFWQ